MWSMVWKTCARLSILCLRQKTKREKRGSRWLVSTDSEFFITLLCSGAEIKSQQGVLGEFLLPLRLGLTRLFCASPWAPSRQIRELAWSCSVRWFGSSSVEPRVRSSVPRRTPQVEKRRYRHLPSLAWGKEQARALLMLIEHVDPHHCSF